MNAAAPISKATRASILRGEQFWAALQGRRMPSKLAPDYFLHQARRDFYDYGITLPKKLRHGEQQLKDPAGHNIILATRGIHPLDTTVTRAIDGLQVRWYESSEGCHPEFPDAFGQMDCAARGIGNLAGISLDGEQIFGAFCKTMDPDTILWEFQEPPRDCRITALTDNHLLHVTLETSDAKYEWPLLMVEQSANAGKSRHKTVKEPIGRSTGDTKIRRSTAITGEEGALPPSAVSVDGAVLLDAVFAFLGRFIAYPSVEAQVAHALWIAHTHFMEAWESTPRIAFLSPESGSGKTRALEISETLVPRPIEAINATPAYLFRKVSDPDGPPTILYDEIDTLFGPRAKDNEEIRGILNAGHRRGAIAGRCVVRGKLIETEELPAYCAVALAGLGGLPNTILTRSVVIRMRRRAPGEVVEPYRRRLHAPKGNALRDQLASWATQIRGTLDTCPGMPDEIADRDADLWEALLAIADAAGGEWPARARVAAVTLVTLAKEVTPSLGVRLLADLRQVFGDREAMATSDILEALVAMEEAPWGDMKGRPIDGRRLGTLLRPYGVTSKTVRIEGRVVRGYTREDLHDPWTRYLPVIDRGEPS